MAEDYFTRKEGLKITAYQKLSIAQNYSTWLKDKHNRNYQANIIND
jgi:hypothetical protein